MSTKDSSTGIERLVDIIRLVVTIVLGSIGAAAGFTHTHDWAVHHGQLGWLAWADAVVIEGLVIVAGFEVQRDHRTRPDRKVTFPLAVLVAGFGVQMAAQVSLAEPTPAGWLVAAMPALGFLVVVKLLMRRAPTPAPAKPTMPAEIPAAAPPADPVPAPAMPAELAPAPPAPPAPVTSPRLKLPPELTSKIDAAVADAHRAGREVTTDDIRRAVRVPEAMATQIVAQVTRRNGHTITA